MGAGQSGVEIAGSSMGYQVLRVYPDGPANKAGLVAYFDFIIAIGDTRFNRENGAFREILKASIDQKLKMTVFNTRTKKTREIEITPSTSWGGNGLLGVSIKHSSFDNADERVWHVVEVEPGSPAHQAGFKANEDYVIGSDSILQENDDLYNLVEAHEGKALKLFVYNTNSDNCREVICYPNSKWGGKGYLGCEFGHGLLHRIPLRETDQTKLSEKSSLLRNEYPVATDPIIPTTTVQAPVLTKPQTSYQPPAQQLLQQALFGEPLKQNQPVHQQLQQPQQQALQMNQQIQQPPQQSQEFDQGRPQFSQQYQPQQPLQLHQLGQLQPMTAPQQQARNIYQQQLPPPPELQHHPPQQQQAPPPPPPPLQQLQQQQQLQQPYQPYQQTQSFQFNHLQQPLQLSHLEDPRQQAHQAYQQQIYLQQHDQSSPQQQATQPQAGVQQIDQQPPTPQQYSPSQKV